MHNKRLQMEKVANWSGWMTERALHGVMHPRFEVTYNRILFFKFREFVL